MNEFYRKAQALSGQLSAWRRAFHQMPELGNQEQETATMVTDALTSMGVEWTREQGGTAVIGQVHGSGEGPVVAMRADMDALPIQEVPGRSYGSRVPGRMHACGHDAHMAILLGAAALLQASRSEWKGTARLLFEPAEELSGAAQRMIRAGCMEGVSAVFGLHMQPSLRVGQLQTRDGAMSGWNDKFVLTVRGQSCHGAYPEKGVDAVVMAAQLVMALQTLVSRRTSPLDSVVLSFGRVEGGTAGNIMAESVRLTGTLRTLCEETRFRLIEEIERLALGLCASMGGSCQVERIPGCHAVICAPEPTASLRRLAGDIGVQAIEKPTPSLGVDSFGDYCQWAPGLYYDLGCASGEGAPPIHTPDFDLDEACLPIGAYLQATLTLEALRAYP